MQAPAVCGNRGTVDHKTYTVPPHLHRAGPCGVVWKFEGVTASFKNRLTTPPTQSGGIRSHKFVSSNTGTYVIKPACLQQSQCVYVLRFPDCTLAEDTARDDGFQYLFASLFLPACGRRLVSAGTSITNSPLLFTPTRTPEGGTGEGPFLPLVVVMAMMFVGVVIA